MKHGLEYAWVPEWVAQEEAAAEALPSAARAGHLAWVANERTELAVKYAASCAKNAEWRQQLCDWLAEAEQDRASAQLAVARARARKHRAFRADDVKAAEQHCREAEDALDEVLEKVEMLTEQISFWTPDGELSDEGQRISEELAADGLQAVRVPDENPN